MSKTHASASLTVSVSLQAAIALVWEKGLCENNNGHQKIVQTTSPPLDYDCEVNM